MRINHVLMVFALVALSCATGELICSEELFDGLGGVLPSPGSSLEYARCIQGVVNTVACPSGHYFDAQANKCLYGQTVPKTHMEASFQFEELCTNPNVVEIFPNPTNCSQYIICYGLVPIVQYCTYGLLFNPELNICDVPTNVVCAYSCPAVDDPNNPVWLPDARLEDCARHYLCFQGSSLPFYCYSNLYFDMVSQTCTYPQYSSCRVPGVYCNANMTHNIGNPRSCTSYYVCEDGFPHFRNCGFEEYFSEQQGACVPGFCEPGTTTTVGSTTYEPISTTGMTPSISSTTDWNTATTDFTSTTIPFTTSPSFTTQEPTSTTSELTSSSVLTTPDFPTTSTMVSTTLETTSELVTDSSTVELSTTTSTQELSTTTLAPSTTTIDAVSTTVEISTETSTQELSTTTLEPSTTTIDAVSTTVDISTETSTQEFSTDASTSTTDEVSTTVEISTQTFSQELSTTTTESTDLSTTDEINTESTTQEVSTTTSELTTTTTEELSSTAEISTQTSTQDVSTTTSETPTTTTEEMSTTAEISTSTQEVSTVTATTDEISTSTSTQEISTTTTELTTSTDSTTVEPTTATTETTPATETTTITTTEMVTIDPNEACAGLGIVILPYPTNCYMYILCINGIGGVSTCATGQIFNPVTGTCVAGNQDTCTPA